MLIPAHSHQARDGRGCGETPVTATAAGARAARGGAEGATGF